MNRLFNVVGMIAILSTGIMKADASPTESDCSNRAQAAYAVAYARDAGKTDIQLARAVEDTMAPKDWATAKRIVFMVFQNRTLTPDGAFEKEKDTCKTELNQDQ